MEYQCPSFPIFVSFIIFIFILFKTLKKSKISTRNLPPGPWKLPLIGNMHQLAGALPHRRLGTLASKYGPIMRLQLGEITSIVISSPKYAKQVMKTHDITFAQRPHLLATTVATYNYTDIAFAPYGDYWRQMRKICTLELLTAKRVQSFRSIREEEVSKLMRSLSSNAGSAINFSNMINAVTYSIISRAACSKIWKGGDVFIPTMKKFIVAAGGFSLFDVYPSVPALHWFDGTKSRLEKAQKLIDKLFQNIIDEHRTERAARKSGGKDEEDLVDVLLNFQEHGNLEIPLTDDNIKAVILDVFSGGSETSSTTVEWIMSELLKDPRVMEKAQQEVRKVFRKEGNVDESRIHELNYLKLVIKETLRLHPPLPLVLPRECRESCVINDYDIPVNSKIIVNAWAIGRDPNYWKEAEKFYPERFQDSPIDIKGTDYEFLPFGAGRRICPGILFGMSNVEFPFAQLLYHFDWKLPDGVKPETFDMAEDFGVVVKRKNDLYSIATPYIPQLAE
ncbi:cytochrome P450 71D445-like [Mercurialis annua]|uniref:cytochrome P450 71D445-like n=1 Tax=Mercurialis annua TaxID=3986 RepID=UPI00215FE404|nr:cytochrome P450 71D445-like [Mercurialis annua]